MAENAALWRYDPWGCWGSPWVRSPQSCWEGLLGPPRRVGKSYSTNPLSHPVSPNLWTREVGHLQFGPSWQAMFWPLSQPSSKTNSESPTPFSRAAAGDSESLLRGSCPQIRSHRLHPPASYTFSICLSCPLSFCLHRSENSAPSGAQSTLCPSPLGTCWDLSRIMGLEAKRWWGRVLRSSSILRGNCLQGTVSISPGNAGSAPPDGAGKVPTHWGWRGCFHWQRGLRRIWGLGTPPSSRIFPHVLTPQHSLLVFLL